MKDRGWGQKVGLELCTQEQILWGFDLEAPNQISVAKF